MFVLKRVCTGRDLMNSIGNKHTYIHLELKARQLGSRGEASSFRRQ